MAVVIPTPPPIPSDEQLLERFAEGDEAVVEELFRRYRQVAYRVAYRLLGNESDALDAVQDGFIKVLTRLPSFEGRSSFKTWLLRVISNAALDLGRQRRRRDAISLESIRHDDVDLMPRTMMNPTAAMENGETRNILFWAINKLPEAQRRTFVLHAEAQLSYREIAEVLNISIGTVMSRLFYARQKLRAYLDQWVTP